MYMGIIFDFRPSSYYCFHLLQTFTYMLVRRETAEEKEKRKEYERKRRETLSHAFDDLKKVLLDLKCRPANVDSRQQILLEGKSHFCQKKPVTLVSCRFWFFRLACSHVTCP